MGSTSNWDSYWGDEKELEYWQKPDSSVIELIDSLDPKEKPKVLDIGCGIGRHALAFAKAGFDVTAVDGSKQALAELEETANKRSLQVETVEANYLNRIFSPETFHVIICFNVIYHGYKKDFVQVADLCREYLKPGGIFFFTCPTRNDGKYGSGEEIAPHTYRSLNSVHPGDIHYFSDETDINEFINDLYLEALKKNEHYWEHNGVQQFSSYWEVKAVKKTK